MFFCQNGHIIREEEFKIEVSNRSFRYGDGFFESILFIDNQIPYLNFHFKRLVEASEVLQLKLPANFDILFLENTIQELASKNEIISGRIRLMFYRSGAGLYLPDENEASYFLEIKSLAKPDFSLSSIGLKIDVYSDVPKVASVISKFKSNNCLPYIMAALHKEKRGLDECILLNQFGRVADSISSNVFIVDKDEIITCPVEEGGVEGVFRNVLLRLLEQENLKFKIQKLQLDDLECADEIFLTNAIKGIQWVEYFNGNIYGNSISGELIHIINESLKRQVESKFNLSFCFYYFSLFVRIFWSPVFLSLRD